MCDVADMIRIAIGTEPKTHLACKVLEYSILRRTAAKVEFVRMAGRKWEYPADIPVGTGFSLRRWMVPAHYDWKGKAIYLDADQIVLADIQKLWDLLPSRAAAPGGAASPRCSAWLTYQPDKSSSRPVPQTSVMVIDCAAAQAQWGWHIDRAIAHLREEPTRERYSAFMHAQWMTPSPREIPVEWNHLNVHSTGAKDKHGKVPLPATCLLHYTKEPEQPWYVPGHPLANLWKLELMAAIRAGYVTDADLEAALAKWNVREDWRSTNGLHPEYRDYLTGVGRIVGPKPKAGEARRVDLKHDRPLGAGVTTRGTPLRGASALARQAPPAPPPTLWVTSFAADMYAGSGECLVESFLRTRTEGHLLLCTERLADADLPLGPAVSRYALDDDAFLRDWLRRNADIVPRHLGGGHDGICRCRGGPYDTHDKRHRQPCVAHWFNRNAARWFRKIAALRRAVELGPAGEFGAIVWVDADCRFTAAVRTRVVEGWFRKHDPRGGGYNPGRGPVHGVAAFYLKNRRPVIETGCFGINLLPQSGGPAVAQALFQRYTTGQFRADERWDDSFQLQRALVAAKKPAVDLALAVGKEHAEVFPHSALAAYLEHRKGSHGRAGVMT